MSTESIYNTTFRVQYHDIKEELLAAYFNKDLDKDLDLDNNPEIQRNQEEEKEYKREDIIDICQKLYMDELASVFFAEDVIDDKIDDGIKYIFDEISKNPKMVPIFETIKSYEKESGIEPELFIMFVLFSEGLFHITHKCICQQLLTGDMDETLITELIHYLDKEITNDAII